MIKLEKLNHMLKVTDMIVEDTENDIKAMERAPFNGKTVGDAFGKQAASIVTLAKMIKILVEDVKKAGES